MRPCPHRATWVPRFPGCLEAIMLGREKEGADELKRDAAIIRTIMKKLFVALKRLHSLGARQQLAERVRV